MRRFVNALVPLSIAGSLFLASAGSAQVPGSRDAYFRAVGAYFGVSPDEVMILSEWSLPPEEIPVVLFVARRATIPPDAVVALRRRGASWGEVSVRFGAGADAFHLPLERGGEGTVLQGAYQRYQARPRAQWGELTLSDDEIVALVNARVLSSHLGITPDAVLAARASSPGFVEALGRLMQGRRP